VIISPHPIPFGVRQIFVHKVDRKQAILWISVFVPVPILTANFGKDAASAYEKGEISDFRLFYECYVRISLYQNPSFKAFFSSSSMYEILCYIILPYEKWNHLLSAYTSLLNGMLQSCHDGDRIEQGINISFLVVQNLVKPSAKEQAKAEHTPLI
jgi:hypothetical protein